jgi:hypothetical protein
MGEVGSYSHNTGIQASFRRDFLEEIITKLSPERDMIEVPYYLGRENSVCRGQK